MKRYSTSWEYKLRSWWTIIIHLLFMLAELKFKNTKYWWGQGESGSHTVLVGMKNGTGFLENSLAVLLKKQNIHCTFEHLSQRNENFCPHKNLYMIVHSSFICNSPNQNKMFCSRWMVNQTVIIQIYIYPIQFVFLENLD